MNNDTITTFLRGEMIEMPKPQWVIRAQAICNGGEIPWHTAITKVLGFLPFSESIGPDDPEGVQVLTWDIAEGGGRWVEFCTPHHIIDAVWVPENVEWLPFWTKHILPFLQAHAAMATAISLQRLLKCVAPATDGQIPRYAEHAPLPPALLQAAQWGAGR